MTADRRTTMGSALNTGLYVIDDEELADVQRELDQRDEAPVSSLATDPEQLPGLIRQRISAMVSRDDFEPPRLPDIAMEVLHTAEDPRSSAQDLAAIVHRDSFLAGRVLKAANSAMFRPRDRAITRLPEAVARMGVRQVRGIVLAAAMEQTVYQGPHKQLMHELWRASMGAAVGCRLVAHLSRRDADQAFMVGLLHDVGKPVLAWCLDRVLVGELRTMVDYHEVAPPLFHLLHAQVGALIVRGWKLPSGLASIVAHHHDRHPPDEVRRWARTLRIANLLYECWRDSPDDFGEEGMLHNHSLIVRSFREPQAIQRLLNIYPPALETLLVG
jgi:HD-like signal output (HDOD) protein